jgi:hypothetical protein
MDNVNDHIDYDKKILDNPMISPQTRRHTEEELKSLEKWVKDHPTDTHDPSSLELYCNDTPYAEECRHYDL